MALTFAIAIALVMAPEVAPGVAPAGLRRISSLVRGKVFLAGDLRWTPCSTSSRVRRWGLLDVSSREPLVREVSRLPMLRGLLLRGLRVSAAAEGMSL